MVCFEIGKDDERTILLHGPSKTTGDPRDRFQNEHVFKVGASFLDNPLLANIFFCHVVTAQVWMATMASIAKRIELELWPVLQNDETISCTALTWPEFFTNHSFMNVKVLFDLIFFRIVLFNFQPMEYIHF